MLRFPKSVSNKSLVIFAAGTGLSPFLAVLQSPNQWRDVTIIWLTQRLEPASKRTLLHLVTTTASVRALVCVTSSNLFSALLTAVKSWGQNKQYQELHLSRDTRHDGSYLEQIARMANPPLRIPLDNTSHIFACGNAGFCMAVDSWLREQEQCANDHTIDELLAGGFIRYEMFTTLVNMNQARPPVLVSQIVGSPDDAKLIMVNGCAYDMNHLLKIHPGGAWRP